jgi:hypothetical protein
MPEVKKGESDPWWGALLASFFLFGFAVWMYYDLTAFEAEGGTRKMQWILVLVYKFIGKWGIVGFFTLGGAGALYHGVSQLLAKGADNVEAAPARRKKKRAESIDVEE